MAKKLRVGVIGSGGIFQGAHWPGWQALPQCDVVALADVNPQTLESASNLTGVSKEMCFEDYKDMLGKVELDIVDVCTPNCVHRAPTVDAFALGAHVICEKPMTISAKDGVAMIEAGKKAGKLFMVAQSMRFDDGSLVMRDWVDAGYIGDIYWARASLLRRRGVPSWGAFTVKELSAGGPCYDLAVHILDLVLSLMGHPEPVSVSAGMWLEISNKPSMMKHDPRKYTVPEELACGYIRFEGGKGISLETSWAVNSPNETYDVFLAGTKGGMQKNPLTLVREEAGMYLTSSVGINPYAGIRSHSEEIRRFVEAIQKGLPSPVPGEQALITQRILDGLYKSAQKGAEVKV